MPPRAAAAGGAAVAAAAAAAVELLSYPLTIAAAIDKEPVRVEWEIPTALSADRERATRTRARRAEGTLNGGGWRRLGMDAVQGGLGRLSKL